MSAFIPLAERRLCHITECGKPVRCRNLCQTHYSEARRKGELPTLSRRDFAQKIVRAHELPKEPFAKHLYKMFLEKGLTLEKLGKLSGVTGASISRWFTGRAAPRLDLFVAVAGALGIEVTLVEKKAKE